MCTREIYNDSTLIKDKDKYIIYCNNQNVAQFYNEHAKTLLDCFENEYKKCEAILYFEDENWKAIQVFKQNGELALLAKF